MESFCNCSSPSPLFPTGPTF
ncbi:unnamed protein product, partial [Rotaria sp. Silwood2]